MLTLKSILFVLAVHSVLLLFLAMYYWGSVFRIRRMARKILEATQRFYVEHPDLRILNRHDITARMAKELDAAQRLLEPLGLKFVCDMEDQTYTQANGQMVPLRIFADEKKELRVAAYYYPPKKRTFFDFMSELSDGRMLMTSNAAKAESVDVPENMLRNFLEPSTSIEELLEDHRAFLAGKLAKSAEVRCVTAVTPGAIFDQYRLESKQKYEFHRKRGWITVGELHRISPKTPDGVLDRIMVEIQKMLPASELPTKYALHEKKTKFSLTAVILLNIIKYLCFFIPMTTFAISVFPWFDIDVLGVSKGFSFPTPVGSAREILTDNQDNLYLSFPGGSRIFVYRPNGDFVFNYAHYSRAFGRGPKFKVLLQQQGNSVTFINTRPDWPKENYSREVISSDGKYRYAIEPEFFFLDLTQVVRTDQQGHREVIIKPFFLSYIFNALHMAFFILMLLGAFLIEDRVPGFFEPRRPEE